MLKWIEVKQLRLGMFICKMDGPWLNHPFWRSELLLEKKEDLRLILDAGMRRICIDVSKGVDVEIGEPSIRESKPVNSDVVIEPSKPLSATSMEQELARAARICARSKEAVSSMFKELRMGGAIDVVSIAPLVDEISGSVARNSGALTSLARLKTQDDYTYMHSVAVCALMVALAKQLKLDDTEIRSAGLAGLLHDIGKVRSPPGILNKPGKLTAEEYLIMQQHPTVGHEILSQATSVDPIALDVCLHHHEKIDGSGYPSRLCATEISLFAKMCAVCDVYDAVTSERPYNKGWDPADAIQRMAEWSGHFDPKIFQAFVKSIGIYPVGSLVRLQSGKLAIVIEQTKKSLTLPKVKIFFSTKGRCYLMPEIVDLSRPHWTDQIVGRECAENWGLGNLDELWSK